MIVQKSRKVNYSLTATLETINEDIAKNKMKVLVSGFFFFFIAISLIPICIYFLFLLLNYSDLPMIDSIKLDGNLFLVSFDVMLLFYLFIAESFKKSEYNKLSKSLYALVFVVILVSFLPLLSTNLTFIIFLYTVFFAITLFKISKYYYDTKYEISFFEHNNYKGGYGGMVDDPFTVEDDINRAKFAIDGVYSIFGFMFFFYEQITRSIAFLYIIRDKKNVSESARLFVYILNNNIDIQKINSNFTSSSKIILETLGYVMFENNITLCEEVKRKFKLE